MKDTPRISVDEDVEMLDFLLELIEFLKEDGFFGESDDPKVSHERAAIAMISITSYWYRSSQFDAEEDTFSEFCGVVHEGTRKSTDASDESSADP